MRRLVYISGVISFSVTILSTLFKLLHLKGASILLLVGLGSMALIFLPTAAYYQYKKRGAS